MHSMDGVELVNGALTEASASLKLTPTCSVLAIVPALASALLLSTLFYALHSMHYMHSMHSMHSMDSMDSMDSQLYAK